MKTIAKKLLLVSMLPLISQPAIARWQAETFESGKITHYTASSSSTNRDTLEIFCTSTDLRPSLAVYFTDQRFGHRRTYNIEIQIDKNTAITLAASRHAMAFTAPDIPTKLLEQLSAGNYVTVSYTSDLEKQKSIRFSLRGSSKAITDAMKSCKTEGI